MEMSAWGRSVSVGFTFAFPFVSAEEEGERGVIEERRRGHSVMARERVLRRIGRYVMRVYFPVLGRPAAEVVGRERRGSP